MATLTKPPILDETGKEIVAELQKLVLVQESIAGKSYTQIADWQEVGDMVKDGTAVEAFPVGTKLTTKWTDTRTSVSTEYDMVFDVVHHGTAELEDGETVNAMFLQSHYVLPFNTQFDAAEPYNTLATDGATDSNVAQYGYNRWSQSGLRQWLNSAKACASSYTAPTADAEGDTAAGWWTSQHAKDVAPSYVTTANGFLSGFADDFLSVIPAVKVQTQANNVTDSGVTDTTYDRFFLPSAEQHWFNTYLGTTSGVEGEYWEYWKRVDGTTSPLAGWSTYPKMISYSMNNHSEARNVWVRSAHRGSSCYVGNVNASGTVGNYFAYYGAIGAAPACCIC